MDQEEVLDRLRNPDKYRKQKTGTGPSQTQEGEGTSGVSYAPKKSVPIVLWGLLAGLLVLTGLIALYSQYRAENLTGALDQDKVKGLVVNSAEFKPNTGVTYVQVQEGQDRNVAVSNLGSTLPILSRFNLKTFTPQNYETVGAAPWALTENFSSNINDPELMAYLLANDGMARAFITRPDVEPLLEDPQMLQAFAQDQESVADFFESDVVKAVLANEKMLQTVLNSRFVSYLLISKSAKYFREHPQEAVGIINADPHLKALKQNPIVQAWAKENRFVKNAYPVLYAAQKPAAAKKTTASTQKKQNRRKK